ncbi:hypothetical protein [Brevibacillus laterosporus]|uniref:hypothetical protein n=1 Tax=Brevibacillus laterosporus TaxID=1465 RepID=UPI00215C0191|nr:hypothetical protein [Brevibacillus laterosporus]MCR8995137.1 hypothetical protein [Brevibacillus laterosporus]
MINRRAACYYVGFVKNQNKAAKNTLSGQYNEMNLGKMRSAVAKTTRILNLPEYQNIIKEWKRTKKKLKYPTNLTGILFLTVQKISKNVSELVCPFNTIKSRRATNSKN